MELLVINFIEVISMTWFLMSLIQITKRRNICILLMVILNFTIITISNSFIVYDILLTSIIICVNTVILLHFSENELYEILFITCLETLFLCFVSWIALFTCRFITVLNASIVTRLLYIFIGYFVVKFLKDKELYFDKSLYNLLSATLFVLHFCIGHLFQIYFFFEKEYPEMIISFIMIVLFIVIMIFILVKMSELYKSELASEKLKQEKANQDIFLALYDKLRIAKHDLKHLYSLLDSYLKEENYDGIKKLISSKSTELKEIVTPINSVNNLVNIVLNHKLIHAYVKNIDARCEVMVNENLGINDYDLNDLLSNILDNAIENCAENGKIAIKIIQDDHILYVNVSNSINETSDLKTKKDGDNHGFGLKSIQRIANKYQGTLSIDQTIDTFNIYVTLLLNS